MAAAVSVFRRKHTMERLSMHPYFYNSVLGGITSDNIEDRPLTIGHDAWIGANAIITPGCDSIGIGAVIGSGSVVTKSVPNFAIVAANPARRIRYRFDAKTHEQILRSNWWNNSKSECLAYIDQFTIPFRPEDNRLVRIIY